MPLLALPCTPECLSVTFLPPHRPPSAPAGGWQLHGEVLSTWAGYHQESSEHVAALLRDGSFTISPEEALLLPPSVLMASFTDLTVPWYETSDMHLRLQECGVASKLLLYNKVGHADFVIGWRTAANGTAPPAETGGSATPAARLGQATRDYAITAAIRNGCRDARNWAW